MGPRVWRLRRWDTGTTRWLATDVYLMSAGRISNRSAADTLAAYFASTVVHRTAQDFAGPTSGSRHQTVSVRLGPMGVKDRLHKLVDQLDDDAAQRLLAAAETLVPAPRPSDQDELPAFVGSFASGHVDVSTRAEDILRDELGEHRSP